MNSRWVFWFICAILAVAIVEWWVLYSAISAFLHVLKANGVKGL